MALTKVSTGMLKGDAADVDLSIDNNTFYIDSSANFVGIGTASPITALDVRGEISVDYNPTYGLRFYNEDRNNWSSIGNFAATGDVTANLVFRTSQGIAMRIDANGNVGIGGQAPTAFPNWKVLELKGGTAGAMLNFENSASTRVSSVVYDDSLDALRIQNFLANPIWFETDNTERMRIDSSGRVLVGQSSNTGSTNADNLVVGTGSGNNGLTILSGTASGGTLAFADSDANEDGFIAFNHASQFMQFATASTERMRIDSSGNIGIGVTPSAWASGFKALQVDNSGIYSATSANNFYMVNNAYYDNPTFKYIASDYAGVAGFENGAFKWFQAASGTAGDNVPWSTTMMLDSSGNLLVGKTSTSQIVEGIMLQGAEGRINASADGNVAGIFNRLTDDGNIFLFRKDGTTVGSIGADNSAINIGTGNTGVLFYDTATAIYPRTAAGAQSNGAINLGGASDRFKDLYLSGTGYIGTSVGIGTTSPLSSLHLSSTTGAPIYIEDSDATSTFNISELTNNAGNFGIQTRNSSGTFVSTDYQIIKDASGANYHRWFIGNSEKVRLDSSGNVGIGTTSPEKLLHLKTSVINTAFARIESTAVDSYPTLSLKNDAREYQLTAHGPLGDVFTIYDGTAGVHRLVIDSSGLVGIGTTSPVYSIHTKSSQGGVGLIESTSTNSDLYFKDSGTTYNYSNGIGSDGDALRFRSGDGTERMRIDSSGNLLVGGTTVATKVTLNKTGFLGSSTLGSATDSTFTIDVRGNLSTDIVAGEFLGGYLLDAYDASAATGAGISKFNGMHFVAGGNFGPSASDVDLVFATGLNGNATEKMRIYSSGNATFAGTISSGEITSTAKIVSTKAQHTSATSTNAHFRVLPSATTDTTGLSSLFLGTSVLDGYGVSLNGARKGTDGTPGFTLRMHNNSVNGSEVFTIANDGNVNFSGTITSGAITSSGKVTGTWAEFTATDATDPGTDDLNVSGYGIVGNRADSPVYVHNLGAGGVRISSNTALGNQTGAQINDTSSTFFGDVTVGGKIEVGIFNQSQTNSGEAWIGRAADRDDGCLTIQLGGDSATGTVFEIVDRTWSRQIISISGEAPASSFVINSSGNTTFAGDVTVDGDLFVTGATTSVNVEDLNVEQGEITLNYGTGDTSAAANGAGIRIQDAVDASNDATILWDATNDEFDFSHGATFSGDIQAVKLGAGVSPAKPIETRAASGIHLYLYTNTTTSDEGNGPQIEAVGHDGLSSRTFGNITFGKENATSGNYASNMKFWVRQNGGPMAEAFRLNSDLSSTFAGTISSGNITTSGWMSFGIPGAGQNTTGRFLSIEGNADTLGEGSSRIFFTEHNSTTGSMSNYGMSLGYRGGDTSIIGADGNTWTGLSQIGNGEWGMWGHDNNATGGLIMSGDRGATVVRVHTSLHLQKTGTATAGTTAYNSETLQFTASGWDTNDATARDVSWKIRSIPSASVYPDHDLTFIESDQGNEYSKFILHGRGSADYTDPLAASFYGNVNINAGTGISSGAGNLTVAGDISFGSVTDTGAVNLTATSDQGNYQIWHSGSTMTTWGGVGSLNIYNSSGDINFHPSATDSTVEFTSTENWFARPINIDGGTSDGTNDATLYVTATNNNDWGILVNKYNTNATDYGVDIRVGDGASYALRVTGNSVQKFLVNGAGNVTAAGSVTAEGGMGVGSYNASYDFYNNGTSYLNGAVTVDDNLTINGGLYLNNDNVRLKTQKYINLSSYSTSNFYPVVLTNPGNVTGTHHFVISQNSQSGADPYNNNMIVGWARGQGWSDMTYSYDFHYNNYQDGERTILGMYRGTAGSNVIIFYLRGGEQYYFHTESDATPYVTGYNTGTSDPNLTVAMVKDSNGADITGQSDSSQALALLENLLTGSVGWYTRNTQFNYAPTFTGTVTWPSGSSTNANTAYGWGDHSTAGYAAASSLSNYLPLSGGTMTGILTGKNLVLGTANNDGFLSLRTYDDAVNRWDLYTWTDDTFRINYNGAGNDELILNSVGNLQILGSFFCTTVNYSSGMTGTGNIFCDGQIQATGNITAYYTSDRKFKKNIQVIENPIEKVKAISGVHFDWTEEYIEKEGGEDGYFLRKRDVGVIAQEIQEVLPEVVAEKEDSSLAVRYEKIVPLLIEAIKDQQKQIDELKSLLERK